MKIVVRFLSKFSFCTAVATAAIWVAWMAADNRLPYDYNAANSHIIPDPVHQNDSNPTPVITADWALSHINKICPGTVQRFFRDSETKKIIATLDTTPLSRTVQDGDTNLPRTFSLPPLLPPRVGYSALICAECNLFQHFVKPLCFMTPEIEFRVVP